MRRSRWNPSRLTTRWWTTSTSLPLFRMVFIPSLPLLFFVTLWVLLKFLLLLLFPLWILWRVTLTTTISIQNVYVFSVLYCFSIILLVFELLVCSIARQHKTTVSCTLSLGQFATSSLWKESTQISSISFFGKACPHRHCLSLCVPPNGILTSLTSNPNFPQRTSNTFNSSFFLIN